MHLQAAISLKAIAAEAPFRLSPTLIDCHCIVVQPDAQHWCTEWVLINQHCAAIIAAFFETQLCMQCACCGAAGLSTRDGF
jgi:hypothetical protein